MTEKKHDALIRLSAERAKKGSEVSHRPLLHVLMSDGRVTEFKTTTVVIPEGPADEAEATVFWLAINGKGEMFVNENDEPVIVESSRIDIGSPAA